MSDPQRAVDDTIILTTSRAKRLFSLLWRYVLLLKKLRELAETLGIPVSDNLEELKEIEDHHDYLRHLLFPQ